MKNNEIPKEKQNGKIVVSYSGGKDSTAMLLTMIEREVKISDVIFCDTGVEFPDLYNHINRISETVAPVTFLRATESFEYIMCDRPIKRRSQAYEGVPGRQWPRHNNRWCTSELKTRVFNKYIKDKYGDAVKIAIGIAYDEIKRLPNNPGNRIYPLIEYKMSEADCLQKCYDMGYDFYGLYKRFDRVSCFCCPFKSIKELRQLYWFYPDLWNYIKYLDSRCITSYRRDYSIDQLEKRFKEEGKPE